MNKPLAGIRIIDMTHKPGGTACARILAFLGADVIKLEEPKGAMSPRRNQCATGRTRTASSSCCQRHPPPTSAALTLNLKTDRGKELFKQVIAQSDGVAREFRTRRPRPARARAGRSSRSQPSAESTRQSRALVPTALSRIQSYEPMPRRWAGRCSITAFRRNPPIFCRAGDRRSGTGMTWRSHPRRLQQRHNTGQGQLSKSRCKCGWSTSSVSLRDHQRFRRKRCRAAATQMGRGHPSTTTVRPGRPND